MVDHNHKKRGFVFTNIVRSEPGIPGSDKKLKLKMVDHNHNHTREDRFYDSFACQPSLSGQHCRFSIC